MKITATYQLHVDGDTIDLHSAEVTVIQGWTAKSVHMLRDQCPPKAVTKALDEAIARVESAASAPSHE